MCNEAGTIEFRGLIGESNDNPSFNDEPIFLCNGDTLLLGPDLATLPNADFIGDPNPSTTPGIGYAFYQGGKPTVDGMTLTDILLDPFIIESPNNPGRPIIFVDQPDGTATFSNDGTLQSTFNGDDPVSLWFAPITYDSLQPNLEVFYEGSPAGLCVDANVEQSFNVVYLNEIQVNVNAGDCEGTINIAGGLPEFDTSESYSVEIRNSSTGDMAFTDRAARPGNNDFNVLDPGTYDIEVTDSKNCTTQSLSLIHI